MSNKSRLLSEERTTPRAELSAALISSRVFDLVIYQLATFLSEFKGEVVFQILGDTEIVIAQLKKQTYKFHKYVASRIAEIRENTKSYPVQWLHVPSKSNIADVLTRPYRCEPGTLPWIGSSMDLGTHSSKVVPDIPVDQLPDVNKSEIALMTNSQIIQKVENKFII